jgi:uncharacterized protein (TIGR02145 family)
VGDVVDLCLVYTKEGGVVAQNYQQKTVTIDPGNPKKATFSLTVPADVVDKFDLYGLYGGDGLSVADYTKALLPDAGKALANDLKDIQNQRVVMLGFETLAISKSATDINASFQHLGSIFRILVKNTGSATLENITHAVLSPLGLGTTVPVYPNANKFNLINKTFTDAADNPASQANSLTFAANTAFIVKDGILAFWAWFPVEKGTGTGATWPALNLTLQQGGSDLVTTATPKPTRVATTGKTYHLFAEYDGTNLTFVGSDAFTVPDGTVDGTNKGLLADTRDGNLYATVKIGNQTWMAENMKFLPKVNPNKDVEVTANHSTSNPFYYVYAYNGTSVELAKRESNYTIYGVHYNWPATMDGKASSNPDGTISSGVQGPCPPGWHVPSDNEWVVLETWLRNNLYTYDGLPSINVRTKIAKALATDPEVNPKWTPVLTPVGAIGNKDYPLKMNASGFSALPAGNIVKGKYGGQGEETFFNTTYETSTNPVVYKLAYNSANLGREYLGKSSGMSVRCLKD